MERMVELIIGIAVALLVASAILPTALTAMATTALTSVNAGVITMFQVLLPILGIVAIALAFLRHTGRV